MTNFIRNTPFKTGMILTPREPHVFRVVIVIFFMCCIGLNDSVSAKSVKKRVGDRFKDWKDEDEYVDHDYYKRKRDREERLREREQLDRERERLRERERELQREKDHKELLEKLLKSTNSNNQQPVAAISAVTMPPPAAPATSAAPVQSQIQPPPIHQQLSPEIPTQSLQQYGADATTSFSGNNWLPEADGVHNEIYASTNLGGGIYDTNDFTSPFGSSPMIGGSEDWKDLAHWYREQNWNLENFNDWSPQGSRPRYKHHRKHNKGQKISGVKGGIIKAKITALYVKKIGIAFLVALLAPLVVITVFGPFLTALSLVPLNFQTWGQPLVNQPQLLQPGHSHLYSQVQRFKNPVTGIEANSTLTKRGIPTVQLLKSPSKRQHS